MIHHPHEIAQAQACYGTHLANFWMHGSFLKIDNTRMGKSVGNFMTLKDIMKQGYDALVWRFYCLNAHYRAKLNFPIEGVNQAATALKRLRKSTYQWGEAGSIDDDYLTKFAEQINDDLNMPRGLAITRDLLNSNLPDSTKKATVLEFDQVLGMGLANWKPPVDKIPERIRTLITKRELARQNGNWQEADAIREQIHKLGYEIEDTPDGTRSRVRK